MAQAQVPVLITTINQNGREPSLGTFGVGFAAARNANGAPMYSNITGAEQALACASGNPVNGVSCPAGGAPTPNGTTPVYGKTINPLLNLTAWNTGSGTLTPIPPSVAPGYVITPNGFYLGLPQGIANGTSAITTGKALLVGLTPLAQSPASTTPSQYALNATQSDWNTPPMLMRVSSSSSPNG